jgi:deoxyribonuclease IV
VAAHERAVERGCEAMQVFNQSPRAWRPTRWKPDDVAEFLSLMKAGPIESVTIHAVYLINPATKDRELRKKSADSLIHALRMCDEIRADGVVLHPGSTVGEPQDEALRRVGDMVRDALAESEGCRLLLENTAGAGNTIGRTFEELSASTRATCSRPASTSRRRRRSGRWSSTSRRQSASAACAACT